MSNRPSPLGWLTKFVVAPVSLAVLGYYVVGPRVGGDLMAAAKVPGLNKLVAKSDPAPKKASESGPQYQSGPSSTNTNNSSGGPQVDVEVRPALEAPVEEPKPKPRRKRRKPKPTPPVEVAKPAPEPEAPAPTILEPVPTTPPPTDPSTDQGGSGGAATAGGA